MPVDAFGRQALTLDEVIEALTDLSKLGLGKNPVWVDSISLFKPVKNVTANFIGRVVLEVHHV